MALRYTFNLGPPQAADVVKRTVITDVNGTVTENEITDPANFATFQLVVEQGRTVKIHTMDTDDADNLSAPSPVLEFVASDTIPPPAPLLPSVTGVEELP